MTAIRKVHYIAFSEKTDIIYLKKMLRFKCEKKDHRSFSMSS